MKKKIAPSPEIMESIKFRRRTGVYPETFVKMVEILRAAHAKKKARGGRPNKLSIENMLLMALEYWREYRTFFHIGTDYGLSESNTYYTIKWVEDVLIKDGTFSLPGKKALLEANSKLEIILPDATETPIERPKRGKKITTQGRKNAIH